MKSIIKIVSVSLILFFGLNNMAIGQSASTQSTPATGVIKYELKVKGASCKTDLGMIVTNVKKLEGVKACEVIKRGATSTLEVEYLTRKVDFKAIKTAIENTGTCEDPNARKYKVKL